MNKASRAIIKIENEYILIKREKIINRKREIFYVIPGGCIEKNESYENACIREIYEELGIKIEVKQLILELYNTDLDKYEVFYIADYISGEIGTGLGEEFTNPDFEKYGSYEIVRIKACEIRNYNILPIQIKEKLLSL